MQRVGSGVYAVIGERDDPAPRNRGIVGNYGVLVGTDGVILVNTGTSARHMRDLLDTVRAITSQPILLAINTHQHPAFIFGNGTLARLGVPILAHREVGTLMAERCARCLKILQAALGAEEMEGTQVVAPTELIDDGATLTVGGRTIDILYYGHTSARGAIAVYDRAGGVLFGGGMVSVDRIPDVKDADIAAWRAALDRMQTLGARRVVPGEGPVSPPSRLGELGRYLASLESAVASAYRRRVSLGGAAADAQQPAFRSWALYDSMHRKNVEQLYLRLEQAELDSN